MRRKFANDERGQMLLMTGLILMFALLTMSLNTVRTASLGEPYDAQEDAVLDTSAETLTVWQPLMEIVRSLSMMPVQMKLKQQLQRLNRLQMI